MHCMQAPHISLESHMINVLSDHAYISIVNEGHGDALFFFRGLQTGASTGATDDSKARIPPWLCLVPNRGIVPAQRSARVAVVVNKLLPSFKLAHLGEQEVRVRACDTLFAYVDTRVTACAHACHCVRGAVTLYP
jgi:hypothetical protein